MRRYLHNCQWGHRSNFERPVTWQLVTDSKWIVKDTRTRQQYPVSQVAFPLSVEVIFPPVVIKGGSIAVTHLYFSVTLPYIFTFAVNICRVSFATGHNCISLIGKKKELQGVPCFKRSWYQGYKWSTTITYESFRDHNLFSISIENAQCALLYSASCNSIVEDTEAGK